MAIREWELEGYGDQHNIGIRARRINGTGDWDDLMLPTPVKVIDATGMPSKEELRLAHKDLLRMALKDIRTSEPINYESTSRVLAWLESLAAE